MQKKNQRPLEVRHRLPDHDCTSSGFPTEPYGYVYETRSAQRRRMVQFIPCSSIQRHADSSMAQDRSRRSLIQPDGQQLLIPRQGVQKCPPLPPVTPIRYSPRHAQDGAAQAILLTSPVALTVSSEASEDLVFTADTASIPALPSEYPESQVCPDRLQEGFADRLVAGTDTIRRHVTSHSQ